MKSPNFLFDGSGGAISTCDWLSAMLMREEDLVVSRKYTKPDHGCLAQTDTLRPARYPLIVAEAAHAPTAWAPGHDAWVPRTTRTHGETQANRDLPRVQRGRGGAAVLRAPAAGPREARNRLRRRSALLQQRIHRRN